MYHMYGNFPSYRVSTTPRVITIEKINFFLRLFWLFSDIRPSSSIPSSHLNDCWFVVIMNSTDPEASEKGGGRERREREG